MARYALLSVSDKRGLVEFATGLVKRHGFTLLSTGGTARLLSDQGLPVTEVSRHTGCSAGATRPTTWRRPSPTGST